MTVAFVLQGGASLAAAQVGMLAALLEAGIRPDIVVGTSAGALNAVAFAQNPTAAGLDDLRRLWSRVTRRDVFPVRPVTALAGLLGRTDGLVSPAPLRLWLERGVAIRNLEDSAIRVSAVATDARSGEAVVLSSGRAIDALLASVAVPGVFPAVELHGMRLVDGGVAADLPIRQAEQLGATASYILPRAAMADPGTRPQGAVGAMVRAAQQMLARSSDADVAAARHEVRVLPAPVTAATSQFDFRCTRRLMEDGYATARSWLGSGSWQGPAVASTFSRLSQRTAA